jgi:tellurite resistance protein
MTHQTDRKALGAVAGNKKTIFPLAPASFFAMTLGLAETGNAWRNASTLWHLSAWVGEVLEALAIASFVVWIAIYINKWISYKAEAKREFHDPVQASFLALIPESIILIALAWVSYHAATATCFFWVGSVLNLLYGAYRLSTLWTMDREQGQTTPSLFLTFTASILVNALAAGIFGYTSYGFALLGIGTIAWLVLDSVITHQLIVGGLAAKTRNFMGIYMAPSVVIFVAYQVLSGEQSNLSISYALAGYAVFIVVALGFAFRWLREQAFAPGYWAYTFGIATLSQGLSLLCLKADNPVVQLLAVAAFVLTNVVLVAVVIGSVRLLAKGQYFPK